METLATALYVKIDDMLKDWPDLAPDRPADGIMPTLSDAELLTMAVMSALLGFTSERRWLRYADENLAGMFPRRRSSSRSTGPSRGSLTWNDTAAAPLAASSPGSWPGSWH